MLRGAIVAQLENCSNSDGQFISQGSCAPKKLFGLVVSALTQNTLQKLYRKLSNFGQVASLK